jgi:large subunit ribosomal protein L10
MATQLKKDTVALLSEGIKNNGAIYLVDYLGINANNDNKMRRDLKKSDITYYVAKNTLLKIALKENGIDSMDAFLEKGTAVAMSNDLVGVVKKIDEYSKKLKGLPQGKAVYYEGTVYSGAELVKLSKLPSKEELIAKVVGGIASPLTGLVFALSGIQKSLLYTINAIIDTKK